MKVKWIIESDFPLGTQGKIYDVLDVAIKGPKKRKWYQINTDMYETYYVPASYFEIVEE